MIYGNNNNNQGWNWNQQRNIAQYPTALPHYEIIEVYGEAGARSFKMGPNSSQYLSDLTDPHTMWVAQTDGAGYMTLTRLDVNIHQDQPQPDLNNLETRIKQLEDTLNEYVNSRTNKQQSTKKQPTNNSTAAATTTNSST